MVLNLKSLEMSIRHESLGRSKDSVRVEMPTKNPVAKYTDGQYQFKVLFVIYADFDSILVPVSGMPSGSLNNPEMSSTRGINVHQPSGWCMYSKFAYEAQPGAALQPHGQGIDQLEQYRGRDVSKCCEHTMVEVKRLRTKEQNIEFITAKECHICFKNFQQKIEKLEELLTLLVT